MNIQHTCHRRYFFIRLLMFFLEQYIVDTFTNSNKIADSKYSGLYQKKGVIWTQRMSFKLDFQLG